MPLTDTKIKQAKPADKAYSLADGQGLYLDVRPTGAKIFRYRYWINPKKAGIYTVGEYPQVTLADARKERERVRDLVKQGLNPNQEKKADKLRKHIAGADTFEAIAREWIEKKSPGWTTYYIGQITKGFENDVYPHIGTLPVKKINSLQILNLLQLVEKRGAPTVAMNLRMWISSVFSYAIVTLRAELDPASALRGAIIRPPVEHAKPLSKDGIKLFLERLANFGGNRITAIALELLLLLFMRTIELRKGEWAEMPEGAIDWNIEPGKMKKRRHHIIPLPHQARALIAELRTITGSGRWMFPNTRRPYEMMSATTVNRALEHMGYGSAELTGHDFRATASTLLHEMGYNDDWIELQLAHVDKNKTRAAYNHARYINERRQMMQDWADFIDTLRPQSAHPDQ
jgi:integrase